MGFEVAISQKIGEILADLRPTAPIQKNLFEQKVEQGQIHLFDGSSLDVMPKLSDGEYDAIITSPPYCNRYDYTRTYALELALLGAHNYTSWRDHVHLGLERMWGEGNW